jgi:hypothetical protein
MKTLIEDYERRLKSVEDMLNNFKSSGSINDIRKDERLKTKASEYRTLIAELRRDSKVIAEEVVEAVAQTIDRTQQGDYGSLTISNEDWFNDEQFEIMKQAVKITRFT